MNDPLPLENLPEYLKNHRNGDPNGSPVIGMGQIVAPRTNWSKIATYITAACLLIGISGFVSYNTLSAKSVIVVITAQDADQAFIANIISNGGGKVASVKRNDDSTYEVRMSTRKNLNTFLDSLLKNKQVKRVELEQ